MSRNPIINLVIVAIIALLAGCATMHRGTDGKLEVSASAVTPHGATALIDASARYTLAEAQAACMQDPTRCGWYVPVYPTGAVNITNDYYFQRTGVTRATDNLGAATLINGELLYELRKTEGELEQSRRDFGVLIQQQAEE